MAFDDSLRWVVLFSTFFYLTAESKSVFYLNFSDDYLDKFGYCYEVDAQTDLVHVQSELLSSC